MERRQGVRPHDLVLANIEGMNAEFIHMGLVQGDRQISVHAGSAGSPPEPLEWSNQATQVWAGPRMENKIS